MPRFGTVLLHGVARVALVACLRLPPDGALEEHRTVAEAVGRYERRRGRAPSVSDAPHRPILCDERLPQMGQDILQAYQFQGPAAELLMENTKAIRRMPSSTCSVIKGFLGEGLTWNAVGMDFSKLFQNQSRSVNETIEAIHTNVLPYYWGASPAIGKLMDMDHQGRWSVRPLQMYALTYSRKIDAEQFRRDGFFKFENLGVDPHLLKKQVDFHLGFDTSRLKSVGVRLDGMEPIVHNEHLKDLASYYLGKPAAMTGYKILRLGNRVSRQKYMSGYWHHDRCGTRLKLFVFVEDVREDGMTTEIATGTQNTMPFSFNNAAASRYSDEYVAGRFRTAKMTGPAGGGFIFDTNTVHKGNVDGVHGVPRQKRDVVIVEYAPADKIEQGVPGNGGPCPEPGTYRGD